MSRPLVLLVGLALMILNGCSHLLFLPSRALVMDPGRLGIPYEDIYFHSADGTKLHGWFIPARTQQAKGTFVQFHGNAENISTHFRSLLWVIDHGYHLFTFDYRGYGLSEGRPALAGAIDDVRAAITTVRRLPVSEAQSPLILYGQSLGGALLLYVVGPMKDRDDIALVVADSSFSSYQTIAREKLAEHWLTFLLQPLVYLLVTEHYAPDRVLAKIAPTPLLVIHGDRDTIVPLRYGQRIYDRANPPKWFWKLDGIGHIQAMSLRPGVHRQALLEFLEHLANGRKRE